MIGEDQEEDGRSKEEAGNMTEEVEAWWRRKKWSGNVEEKEKEGEEEVQEERGGEAEAKEEGKKWKRSL